MAVAMSSRIEDDENVDRPTFVCPTCNQSYSRAEYLRRHERKHTATRPFVCDDCPKKFARSDVLLRHRRRCHPEEAALTEPVKATGPKKFPRPRNPNRPYPPRAPKSRILLSTPEPDSAGGDEEASASTNVLDNVSYVRGSPLQEPSNSVPSNSLSGFHATLSVPSLLPDVSPNPIASSSTPPWPSGPSGSKSGPWNSPSLLQSSVPYINSQYQFQSPVENTQTSSSFGHFPSSPSNRSGTSESSHISSSPRAPLSKSEIDAGIRPWAFGETLQEGVSTDTLYSTENSLATVEAWVGAYYASPRIPLEILDSGDHQDNGNDSGWKQLQVSRPLSPFIGANGEIISVQNLLEPCVQPEIAMINSEAIVRSYFSGEKNFIQDPMGPFYIPPGMFQWCYTIQHWCLPPLSRLSEFAANTFRNILRDFGIIHEPTFRLIDMHRLLAFAICTAAGHRRYYTCPQLPQTPEPWDAVPSIVRTEKSDRLVKSLAGEGTTFNEVEHMTAIQALLIYNAHSFLSMEPSDRLINELCLGAIAKIVRTFGLLNPNRNFATWTIETDWRRWVQSEGFRRTAWLIYVLDAVSSFEATVDPLISPRDVKHLPIPAPQSLWAAGTAEEWSQLQSRSEGVPLQLDFILEKLFDFETEQVNQKAVSPSLIDVVELGPFARLVMVITLVKGIIEYGEGKPKGGYVVQRWILGGKDTWWAATGYGYDPKSEASHERILTVLDMAVERWKTGWELDFLCNNTNQDPTTQTFVHDAMPFWWLAHLLLTHLRSVQVPSNSSTYGVISVDDIDVRQVDQGPNRMHGVDLARMLQTARTLSMKMHPNDELS